MVSVTITAAFSYFSAFCHLNNLSEVVPADVYILSSMCITCLSVPTAIKVEGFSISKFLPAIEIDILEEIWFIY